MHRTWAGGSTREGKRVGLTGGWTRRAATGANAARDSAGAGVLQDRCRPRAAAREVKHRETVRPYRQGTSAQGRRARSLPRELPTKVQLLCQEHSPNGHSLRSIILAADGGGQAVVQVRLIQPLPPAHRRPPAASVQQKHRASVQSPAGWQLQALGWPGLSR